jgi:hypothetical protein
MKDLIKLQVIHIATKNGKLVATLSFQDLAVPIDLDDVNDGYRTIEVPVNLRDLQLSSRGNQLVNQSIKEEHTALTQPLDEETLSPAFLKSIETIQKYLKRQ